jgi:uncharacterized membrane protein
MTTSTILVLMYPEENIADEVMAKVHELQGQNWMELEDACVVVKDELGKIKIHQSYNLPLVAATGGALLGSIIGMIFLVPYIGAAVGAAAGVLGGLLADIGIDDDFMKTIALELGPKSSALFLLVKSVNLEKVVPELAAFDGTVLHTSFSEKQEIELIKMFEAAKSHETSRDLHP